MTAPATPQQRADLANRIVEFEERAGIIQDSGAVRALAEDMAAEQLGYRPDWGGSVVRLIDAGAWRP